MFAKQIDKINSLLNEAKQESSLKVDSIALISTHVSRSKTAKTGFISTRPKYDKRIILIKEQVPKEYEEILENLFKAKCEDLTIEHNEHNWESFVKAFIAKNKIMNDESERIWLNFSDFNMGQSCMVHINKLLKEHPSLINVNLSKNTINPNKMIRLQTTKEIVLNNCKLGNDFLQKLFDQLHDSAIERISLSSPELKNRNQLTRYEKIIALIKKSSTLRTLELSNIEINPNNGILENSKNAALKVIDLSDNTNVKGISTTIKSLNLARNNITIPFTLPLTPCELQYLNLSYNKIPYYHFKQFLKPAYFPFLSHLILDHINLHGEIYSIQNFIELSNHLTILSAVDCDFSQQSYINILNGIKNAKSLKIVDLTRNRIMNEKVAEHVSVMFQGCNILEIKMRHCDIKDNLGRLIFKNIRKNKVIEKIDMMNNLLGDETARVICEQLKFTKNIVLMSLQENIIKYKDMHEIRSYLEGNKYHNYHILDKEYQKLHSINQQNVEANRIISIDGEKINKLQKEADQLELVYYDKFKKDAQRKKIEYKQEIMRLRAEQGTIQKQITMNEMLLPSMNSMISMVSDVSRRDSILEQSDNLRTSVIH